MLHTTNPVIKHKAGLLNLAEELSNVSKACKIMGVLNRPGFPGECFICELRLP
ncbi:helix-turn-helix domain-containing protein, partial [Escherichia coli]